MEGESTVADACDKLSGLAQGHADYHSGANGTWQRPHKSPI
jgi:hypothetical protein